MFLRKALKIFFLSTILAFGGLPSFSQTAEALCDEGRQLYFDSKYPEARKALEACLKLNPKSAGAHILLGKISWADNPGDAFKHFKKAAKLEPGNPEHYATIAMSYTFLKKTSKALKYYHKALKADSTYYEAWLEGGRLYVEMKDRINGLRWLNKAVAYSEIDPKAWGYRAALYLEMDSLSKAATDNEAALRLSGGVFRTPSIWIQRGWIQLAKGNRATSVNSFEKAHELFPTDCKPIAWLARTRGQLGDSTGFNLYLLCKDPGTFAGITTVEWFLDHGKLPEAKPTLYILREEGKKDPWVQTLLARYHNQLGETKLAMKYCRRAHSLVMKQKTAPWLQREMKLAEVCKDWKPFY